MIGDVLVERTVAETLPAGWRVLICADVCVCRVSADILQMTFFKYQQQSCLVTNDSSRSRMHSPVLTGSPSVWGRSSACKAVSVSE
jgi:hypothetical protein